MCDKKYQSKTKILVAVAAIVLVSAAVVAFLLLRPKNGDGYRSIVVAEVSGSVLVSNDEKQDVSAYEGMALFDGDTITVSKDAALTIELDGDKYMMAEAGTKFRLEATGQAGSDRTVIHLESGAALNHIQKALNEDQSYVVKTPTSVISVRGTFYRVAIEKMGEGKLGTKCDAFTGQVEVIPIDPDGNQTEEPQVLSAGSSVSVMEIPADENNGKQSAAFVRDEAGNAQGKVNYGELPKNVIERLIDCIESGEKLDVSKEELEEYLHKHTYEDSWTYDDQAHWYAATCEHIPQERKDVEMHSFDDGVVTTPATHLATGVMTYSCKCGYTKTEAVAKLTEHSWSDWKAADGENHSAVCECREARSEAHAWDGGVITVRPTHLTEGETTFTCTVCNYTKTEAVAKLTEHTWSDWEAAGEENHSRACECGEMQQAAHNFGDGEEGMDSTGAEAMVYTCSGCQYQKYEIIQSPKGQFKVDKAGYETWHEAAMALSNSNSQTVYLLRDLWEDSFSYIFGAVSLPHDQTDVSGSGIPTFNEMIWDLNGYGFRLFGDEKTPPRIYAGATWTIRATGGGMLSTNGLGLYCPWYGGVLEGEIVILGGMFDFDPTEYVPEGYTVQMVLAPDFYQGTDASAPATDYTVILEQYGTYSAIMNDRDKDEAELYQCRTPGLWIVYPDGDVPAACEHECFTYHNTVDNVDHDYCSGCGAEVAHRHSVSWLKNPDTHSQTCATCYETLVDWEGHTFDEGVAGINDFGESGTLYTCDVCGYREMRLTCTGEHIYGAGVRGTDEGGTVVMLYMCIYCDHQVTMENLHECENDWYNPVYNDHYHWYPCVTADCPARLDYGVHSYELGALTWPTHDRPGVMAESCYCGYICPGSESSIEFCAYFLDFSGCTVEGINQYDNTIHVGDAFDYENIKLIGYYEDTTLEQDGNYNIIGYDYGRVLDSDEYTVHIYRLYSYDQKMLLPSLDLTVAGDYEIAYVTADGGYHTVSLTILSGTV